MSSKRSNPLDLEPGRKLAWLKGQYHEDAFLGDFINGDGVRLSLSHHPTCYRRGPWRLLIEVAEGEGHEKWGCFDSQDQPMRYYHREEAARSEAQEIADVLVRDRMQKE